MYFVYLSPFISAYNNTSNRNKHERKKHGGHYPEAQQNQPPQQAFPARHQDSYAAPDVTSNTPSKNSDMS